MKKILVLTSLFPIFGSTNVLAQEEINPPIIVTVGDQLVMDSYAMKEDTTMRVQFNDEVLSDFCILLDDVEISTDSICEVFLTNTDHELFLEAIDQEGNTIHRTILISTIDKDPTIDLEDKSYTLIKEHRIASYGKIDRLLMSIDDVLVDTIDGQGQEELSILIPYEGMVVLEAYDENGNNVPINSCSKFSFYYTDQPILTNLCTDSLSSNTDIMFPITWPKYLSQGNIRVSGPNGESLYSTQDSILLEKMEGQEVTYLIEIWAQDLFGREVFDKSIVTIDAKAPSIDLFTKGQALVSGIEYRFSNQEQFTIAVQDAVTYQIKAFVDGIYTDFNDINQLWGSLYDSNKLTLEVTAWDEYQNENTVSFMLRPVEQLQVISQYETILDTTLQERTSIQHLYTLSEEKEIKIEKKEELHLDTKEPTLILSSSKGLQNLKEGDKLRITLAQEEQEEKFTKLKVNGQEVAMEDISEDALGNPYIELKLNPDIKEIEVEAVDLSNNKKKLVQKLEVEPNRFSSILPISITAGIGATIVLYYVRNKKKES